MDAWTPHDLRRTFSTRLGDLGVAPHVIEKLHHTPEGVAGIYNRAELEAERIAATKLWAAELARIVAEPAALRLPLKEDCPRLAELNTAPGPLPADLH